MQRHADAFLAQAGRYEDAGKWRQAAAVLFRYLRIRPDSPAEMLRLAQDFRRSAEKPEEVTLALQLYARAIGQGNASAAALVEHAELALATGAAQLAAESAEQALDIDAEHSQGWRLLALARLALAANQTSADYDAVEQVCRRAASLNPHDVELATAWAETLLIDGVVRDHTEAVHQANRVMDDLVAQNANLAVAFLARGEYRHRHDLPGADADLDRAYELDAESPEILAAAGGQALEFGHLGRAQELFERLLKLHPHDRRGYLGLGLTRLEESDAAGALAIWSQGRELTAHGELLFGPHIASALLALNRIEEAQILIESLVQLAPRHARGATLPNQLLSSALRQLERCRVDLDLAQRPRQSLTILEQAVDQAADPTVKVSLLERLAERHVDHQHWDLAASCYGQCAKLQPRVWEHHRNLARAWQSAGRWEDAAESYRRALELRAPLDERVRLRMLRAEMLLAAEAFKPPAARSWQAWDETIHARGAGSLGSIDLEELTARRELAEGNDAAALARLESIVTQSPERASARDLFGEALLRSRQFARVLEWIESAPRSDKHVSSRLLRARALEQLDRADDAEQTLLEGLRSTVARERADSRQALLGLRLRRRMFGPAASLLAAWEQSEPDNVHVTRCRAELAMAEHNWELADKCEQQLRAMEGQRGALWRLTRAQRLLNQPTTQTTIARDAAERLLDEAVALRPDWPLAHAALADAALARGETERAVAGYQRAIALGDRAPSVVSRLATALLQSGRLAEVSALLAGASEAKPLMDNAAPGFPSLAPTAAESELLACWSAWLRGDDEGAQARFAQATEAYPDHPQLWWSRLTLLARNPDPRALRELIDTLQAAPFEPAQRALAVAVAWEMAGDEAAAERAYREALEASPRNLDVYRRLARFYLRCDLSLAETCARRVLKLAPDSVDDRRFLARILAQRGPAQRREALELLGRGASLASVATEDLRSQMELMIRSPDPAERQRAIEAGEQIIVRPHAALPIDYLNLAELYEGLAQPQAAEQALRRLLDRDEHQPAWLAGYCALLLRMGRDANGPLSALEKLRPRNPQTLLLRAEQLKQAGRADEAERRLRQFVSAAASDDERLERLGTAAGWFESNGLLDEAEGMLREAAELDHRWFGALVRCRARRRDFAGAVDSCLRDWPRRPRPGTVVALVEVLIQSGLSAPLCAQSEEVLSAAVRDFPDDFAMFQALASLRGLQGRFDAAVELNRAILKARPRDVAALNNLACFLAINSDSRDESRNIARRARNLGGDSATVLDTLAWVELLDQKPREALALLEEARLLGLRDATQWLHLAAARAQNGDAPGAHDALEQARAAGLNESLLMPPERAWLAELSPPTAAAGAGK